MMTKQGETEPTCTKRSRNCNKNEVSSSPESSEFRTSPHLPEIRSKPQESPLASKTTYPFRQDMPPLPSRVRGGSFMDTTPAPNTPVFFPKPITNTPGSTKSAFFSPQSVTRRSPPNLQVVQNIQQHKQGTLIPRLHWKPTSTEFHAPVPAPRAPSPTEFHSSLSHVPLTPRINTVHTFDENEMTAVDAMLSLRYSPVSVTSSPSRIGRTIKNISSYDNKPFLPLFRPMDAPRESERQRRHFIAQDTNLKPGLHMYYS